jgi:hypothetical protein
MKRENVDAYERQRREVLLWEKGIVQWIEDAKNEGFEPFYINVMFKPLWGAGDRLVAEMHRAVRKGFYGRLCTQFVRDPKNPAKHYLLPRLKLWLDRPCYKGMRVGIRELRFNDGGVHMNGFLLAPHQKRFEESFVDHITANQHRYSQKGIERIHVQAMDDNVEAAVKYTLKTVKNSRASLDDTLILPVPAADLESSPYPIFLYRRTKEFRSRFNWSEEVIDHITELLPPGF